MTSKLVVIINSLKVPKIKKILLYEFKFLVPNYSCLQNPWVGGYRPQIPFLSVLNWIYWPPPSPFRTKFLGTPLPPAIGKNVLIIKYDHKNVGVRSSKLYAPLQNGPVISQYFSNHKRFYGDFYDKGDFPKARNINI